MSAVLRLRWRGGDPRRALPERPAWMGARARDRALRRMRDDGAAPQGFDRGGPRSHPPARGETVKAAALEAARLGGEAAPVATPPPIPGASAFAGLPALRLFAALLFLIPGGLLLLAGLVCLYPWLCRFAASPQSQPRPVLGGLHEPTGEAHEPSDHPIFLRGPWGAATRFH